MQDVGSNAGTDSRGRRGEERGWAAHTAGLRASYHRHLIAFQNTAMSLSADDLENGYSWDFLMVRLLVGGLFSAMLYVVIPGHLIGGELFPAPANGASGGFGSLWTVHTGAGMPYVGPSANFAKLIV